MKRLTLAITTLLLSLAVQTVAAPTIVIDAKSLVLDGVADIVIEPGSDQVSADMADWVVTARYFPNSVVTSEEEIGVTDSTGYISWTPLHAGIVSLTARRGEVSVSRSVSVKFPSLPGGAVIVFLVAGIILLGGAGWSLIRLFEHEPKHGLN